MQSRYYNPEVGRFINTDAFATTGQGLLGNNMFVYCNNNPANFQDSTGSKMVYMRADAPAPAGFPSPSTLSRTTPQTADTKENVCKNLIKQAKDSWEYGVEVYNSPLVQRPMGTYSYLDGITSITVGIELILTPSPTLADEIIAIVKIFTGFYDVVTGLKARHPSVQEFDL